MIKAANIGLADRIVRIFAGLALITVPFVTQLSIFQTQLKWVAVAIGAILVITALVRFCPIYKIVGCKTCS